jgi:hypothetical protein
MCVHLKFDKHTRVNTPPTGCVMEELPNGDICIRYAGTSCNGGTPRDQSGFMLQQELSQRAINERQAPGG